MHDAPTAEELLNAMARTLAEEVVPETDGPAQHAARVVANLCRILGREVAASADDHTTSALLSLIGESDPNIDLASRLDQLLQRNDPAFDEAILPLLLADVEHRLAISKPSYLQDVL